MMPNRWLLPHIDQVLDDVSGSNFFKNLDLLSEYWQILMSARSKKKTTFVYREGTFQFEVMLFGVVNAPYIFQRMMDPIIGRIEFAHVYIDDPVIFPRLYMNM